jgi:hypothetical protein
MQRMRCLAENAMLSAIQLLTGFFEEGLYSEQSLGEGHVQTIPFGRDNFLPHVSDIL